MGIIGSLLNGIYEVCETSGHTIVEVMKAIYFDMSEAIHRLRPKLSSMLKIMLLVTSASEEVKLWLIYRMVSLNLPAVNRSPTYKLTYLVLRRRFYSLLYTRLLEPQVPMRNYVHDHLEITSPVGIIRRKSFYIRI